MSLFLVLWMNKKMSNADKKLICIFILLLIFTVSSCSIKREDVKAYQKQYLSLPEMTFGANPLEGTIAEHTFTSKESASGGYGVAGGGCGCN